MLCHVPAVTFRTVECIEFAYGIYIKREKSQRNSCWMHPAVQISSVHVVICSFNVNTLNTWRTLSSLNRKSIDTHITQRAIAVASISRESMR